MLALLLLAACNATSEPLLDEEPLAAQTSSPPAAVIDAPAVLLADPPTPLPSPGQVFYVDPNGSDSDDASLTTPWLTIQHAVDNIAPGDTILLQSGTYAGARMERSGTAAAWITLAAAPGATVLINTPGPNNKHDSILEFETWEGAETVAFWLVDGLEVAAAPNWGIDLRGSEGNHSHHFIICNNQVHDNALSSGKSGIFTGFVESIIVEGNESYANGEHAGARRRWK